MRYAYYSKNTLAILFNETLKQNPDKKEFLMALWQNIKDSASECDEKCENCKAANHCMMIGDAWGLYKKYHSTQDTDQYWSDVVHESERIMKKYDRESNTRVWEGTPKKIIVGFMSLFSIYWNAIWENIANILREKKGLPSGSSGTGNPFRLKRDQFFFPARDLRYFSLSQLAMKSFAASPMVDRV